MTQDERNAKIQQLRQEHREALSTPLMSEGSISPYQVGCMSKRQKEHWQKMVNERFDVEREIRLLSRTDAQIEQDERNAQDRKNKARLTQIDSMIQLLSGFKGKNGKTLPKYAREIERLTTERATITKTAPAWELIEQRADYYFWKYTDSEDKPVYNVTMTPEPPTTDGGYYSYGYLLKVKGLLAGPTVSSIIQGLIG